MFYVDDDFLAHTSPNKLPETLNEHTKLTKIYLEKIKIAKNLAPIIENLIKNTINDENFMRIFENLIIWHDIGKKNPQFQAVKMNNDKFQKEKYKTSTHSDYSFYLIKKEFENFFDEYKKDYKKFYKLVNAFYNLLSNVLNHHSTLKDGFQTSILKYDTKLDTRFKETLGDNRYFDSDIYLYILIKLHYSLLIASDFYATNEYMCNMKADDFGVFDEIKKDQIFTGFKNFYNSLKSTKEIDIFRGEIFKESEQNLLKNLDKNIFYLEAPTGSGKTLTSLNLALNLLNNDKNLNKIFYIFPFNTLISQNKENFEKIFKNILEISVINSITPPIFNENEQEDKESNYDKTYISRTFFNSPFILTSHVSLFKVLFGTTKEENYPLFSLANSVIVLDEIQSYSSNLWEYMAFFFDIFAKALNIKFIIMSATLPKISKLLSSDDSWCDLLPDAKEIFQNRIFKDRVSPNFSLLNLEKMLIFEKICEKIKESKKDKILVEFITKKSAREFYEYLHGKLQNYEILTLDGDDNKLYQKIVINKLKNDGIKVILVATQVIEAGVDIDMDLGFKDIATIESEEQFLGRINRSSLKENSVVYFFDLDDENAVYKNDKRTAFSLKQDELKKAFENKDFSLYYEKLLDELYKQNSSTKNSLEDKRTKFIKKVKELKFKSICDEMKLINDERVRIFLPFKLDISEYDISEFGDISEFLSGNLLDGQKVWNAIIDLNEIDVYAEKKIKTLKINALANIFSFSVYKVSTLLDAKYGYYFIDEYEELIDENGKFLRAKFANKFNNKELFL